MNVDDTAALTTADQKTGTAVTQLEQAAAALDESGQALGEAIQGTRPMGRQ